SLFSYALQKVTGAASEQRKQLQRGFLEHVTNMERSGGAADIAFMYASGERIDPSLLRELRGRGIWTVLMSLDDKHQLNAPPTGDLIGWQLEVAREADLYWTTWRAGADWLVARGVNAWYAPEGADPGIFAPRQCERDIEVLWLGRGYGRRVELVRYLRERGLSVEAFGPGWDSGRVAFDRMLDLYQRSKIVLGMGGVLQSDRVKHLKGRDFEVPMAGCLYLTSYNPELTDWFAVGSEILCYSSFEDCAEVITWVLRRPDVADGIRGRARCRALAQHTWDHRVGSVLAMIRGKASR
ncbi:MAG: CgeB family protein, partial [Thermoanaerobaculia bacterium]